MQGSQHCPVLSPPWGTHAGECRPPRAASCVSTGGGGGLTVNACSNLRSEKASHLVAISVQILLMIIGVEPF